VLLYGYPQYLICFEKKLNKVNPLFFGMEDVQFKNHGLVFLYKWSWVKLNNLLQITALNCCY